MQTASEKQALVPTATSFEAELARVRIWPVVPLMLGTYIGSIVLLPRALDEAVRTFIKVSATFIVVLVWWMRAIPRKHYSLRQIIGRGLDRRGWALVCLGSISALWVNWAWSYALGRWGAPLGLVPESPTAREPAAPAPGAAVVWIEAWTTVFLFPILEELVFRGMLFRKWRQRWGPAQSAVASSLVFGVLHANAVGTGFSSLVNVLLYTATGTLWAPIAAHCINNGIAQAYVLLSPRGLSGIPDQLFYPVVLAGLALSMSWLVWFVRRNWKTLGDPLAPDGPRVMPHA